MSDKWPNGMLDLDSYYQWSNMMDRLLNTFTLLIIQITNNRINIQLDPRINEKIEFYRELLDYIDKEMEIGAIQFENIMDRSMNGDAEEDHMSGIINEYKGFSISVKEVNGAWDGKARDENNTFVTIGNLNQYKAYGDLVVIIDRHIQMQLIRDLIALLDGDELERMHPYDCGFWYPESASECTCGYFKIIRELKEASDIYWSDPEAQ